MKQLFILGILIFAGCAKDQGLETKVSELSNLIESQNRYISDLSNEIDSVRQLQAKTEKALSEQSNYANLAINQILKVQSAMGKRDLQIESNFEKLSGEFAGVVLVTKNNIRAMQDFNNRLIVAGNKDQSLSDQIAEIRAETDSIRFDFNDLILRLKKNPITKTVF